MAETEFNKDMEVDDYEPQVVDLDGEPYEIIDGLTYEDVNYVALIPYSEDDTTQEDVEFIILKEVEDGDDFYLGTVDDEELYATLGEAFLQHFNEMFDDCDCEDCSDEHHHCDCGCEHE